MKTFSAFFFLFALFFVSPSLHASATSKGKTQVVITQKTSLHQLDSIKTALATQGIDIDFNFTIYSNSGQLKRIAGSITTPKQSGTFASDDMGTITILIKGSSFKITVAAPAATTATSEH
jgi:hypothetical protein